MVEITNVSIGGRLNGAISLSWNSNGARYHVWVDPQTLEPMKIISDATSPIYKNPPIGIGTGDVGYFKTRRLNPSKAANSAMLKAAQDYAREHRLVEQFMVTDEARNKAADEADQQRLAKQRVRDAAPDMLKALQFVAKALQAIGGPSEAELAEAASVALDAIEKATSIRATRILG